ncbi:MAG: NYN domain-containing protein [Armatimonadetes bacterium]|nr:NYN domain-containing protein [Armatimonadota bacterium]
MAPSFVLVRRSEEKGTDDNIATHLVHDAHLGRFDAAALVSNDSDLAEAVRIVCKDLGKPVHIYRPSTTHPNHKLQSVAASFNNITVHHLSTSQFPANLSDAKGSIAKPPTW